jgi:hypothetical protein
MSGFQLPFGVKPVNPIPVDYYSGPYISNISIEDAIDQANVAIPLRKTEICGKLIRLHIKKIIYR